MRKRPVARCLAAQRCDVRCAMCDVRCAMCGVGRQPHYSRFDSHSLRPCCEGIRQDVDTQLGQSQTAMTLNWSHSAST